MFRERVLVNEDIINRISETMIPVALDYQIVLDRKTPESWFVRSLIQDQGDIQGVYVFSPQGKRLGGSVTFGDMVGKTKRMLERSLKAFGPVEIRNVPKGEPIPNRGIGSWAEGSICLAEYVRLRNPDRIKIPVISLLNLSGKEFETLSPRKAEVGEVWKIPESVAKKLCRLASPMCFQHAPQPEWVKSVVLKGRVQSLRNGFAELSYEGTMSSERRWSNGTILSEADVRFEGEGVCDTAAGKMHSVLILGSGVFRWPEEAPDKPVPFGALIEWDFEATESASD